MIFLFIFRSLDGTTEVTGLQQKHSTHFTALYLYYIKATQEGKTYFIYLGLCQVNIEFYEIKSSSSRTCRLIIVLVINFCSFCDNKSYCDDNKCTVKKKIVQINAKNNSFTITNHYNQLFWQKRINIKKTQDHITIFLIDKNPKSYVKLGYIKIITFMSSLKRIIKICDKDGLAYVCIKFFTW